MSVQITEFENCCGIYIVFDFEKSYSDMGSEERKPQYQSRIKRQTQKWITQLENKRSYLLAVLNTDEIKDGAAEALLELGFKVLVRATRNPNGSTITMYIYKLLPKKTKKKVTSILTSKRK